MDAPPIQYAKTSDGLNIAFWAIGEGPPLVIMPIPVASHIQLEWELDFRRIAYEQLSQRATVVRYDNRGVGLSQHDCFDPSPEAGIRDLEAVLDRLGLDQFAIYGYVSASTTFAFPSEHPDRVTHLIVSVPPLPRRGFRRTASFFDPLIEQDWEILTEIWARLLAGWDSPNASQLAAWTRKSTARPADARAAMDALNTFSPEPFLAKIGAPTLVLYGLASEASSRIARTIAGGIKGAHMIGTPNWPFGTNINETVVAAILDFINTTPTSPGAPISPPQIDVSAVRTIVFTDVEGSTALNERLGDEGARAVMREHERLTREALDAHGGSEVKAMGDGFMAWFPSATRAVECAIALQRSFADQNTAVGRIMTRPYASVSASTPGSRSPRETTSSAPLSSPRRASPRRRAAARSSRQT